MDKIDELLEINTFAGVVLKIKTIVPDSNGLKGEKEFWKFDLDDLGWHDNNLRVKILNDVRKIKNAIEKARTVSEIRQAIEQYATGQEIPGNRRQENRREDLPTGSRRDRLRRMGLSPDRRGKNAGGSVRDVSLGAFETEQIAEELHPGSGHPVENSDDAGGDHAPFDDFRRDGGAHQSRPSSRRHLRRNHQLGDRQGMRRLPAPPSLPSEQSALSGSRGVGKHRSPRNAGGFPAQRPASTTGVTHALKGRVPTRTRPSDPGDTARGSRRKGESRLEKCHRPLLCRSPVGPGEKSSR